VPDPFSNPLLDPAAVPASLYAQLADRLAALLATRNDVLLVQGEAIIALEAAATSLARPGLSALNIVTSPYGRLFGNWLRRGGAEVTDLVAEPGLPITAEAFSAALDRQGKTDVVSLVHAESATGILNPLGEIAALAKAKGAILVVDGVASFGGHPLPVDELAIDVVVIGAQKALAGSAGLSVLSVSPAAWALIDRPDAPVQSTLSLLDHKRTWLDTGRGVLPGMPSALEFHALDAALGRVEGEGLQSIINRHRLAGEASRAALQAMGVPLWVDGEMASNLVTAAPVPEGVTGDALLRQLAPFALGITAGVGEAGHRLVRLNHTGQQACFAQVLANVVAYGEALRVLGHPANIGAAAEAVSARYAGGKES